MSKRIAIKESPTCCMNYYRVMRENSSKKIKELSDKKEILINKINDRRKSVAESYDEYKDSFNVELNKYKEFVENKYIDGSLYKVAKGLFINRKNDYSLVASLFDLYSYATMQKDINGIDKKLEFLNKLHSLTLKEYGDILRTFYTQVHKELILNGYGYAFSGRIGWICVNRVHMGKRGKAVINYRATQKREQELLAQGKRIYNKEEADWCKRNGIEYNAEDKRVFMQNEIVYEIPLINCTCTNAHRLKLTIADFRGIPYRGKTNEDLLELCNNDVNKICELSVDLKTKLLLCNKADKLLYTKFIRNENQTALRYGKVDSKNRQRLQH